MDGSVPLQSSQYEVPTEPSDGEKLSEPRMTDLCLAESVVAIAHDEDGIAN